MCGFSDPLYDRLYIRVQSQLAHIRFWQGLCSAHTSEASPPAIATSALAPGTFSAFCPRRELGCVERSAVEDDTVFVSHCKLIVNPDCYRIANCNANPTYLPALGVGATLGARSLYVLCDAGT